jgi:hypothetical protein
MLEKILDGSEPIFSAGADEEAAAEEDELLPEGAGRV